VVTECRRSDGGFTLIELLVALAVFAVLAGIAYSTLEATLDARAETETRNGRRADIMRALTLMERDMLQMTRRPITDEFGRVAPPLIIEERPVARIEFTRTGVPNPRHEKRGALQRVAYLVEDDALVRRVWGVLDRTAQTTAFDERLLEDVESIGFQVLQNDWTETWPAETELGGQVVEAMPRAVRIRVELKDLGELVRELPLAGSTTAVEATTRGSR